MAALVAASDGAAGPGQSVSVKGLDVGADKVYDLAKKAAEQGHGAFAGFKLWTRIRYEQCECGLLWDAKWKKKTDWEQFSRRTFNNNDFIYEVKLNGYADVETACEAFLAEFNK